MDTKEDRIQEKESPYFRIILTNNNTNTIDHVDVFNIHEHSQYFEGNTNWTKIRYLYSECKMSRIKNIKISLVLT